MELTQLILQYIRDFRRNHGVGSIDAVWQRATAKHLHGFSLVKARLQNLKQLLLAPLCFSFFIPLCTLARALRHKSNKIGAQMY